MFITRKCPDIVIYTDVSPQLHAIPGRSVADEQTTFTYVNSTPE